MEKLREHLKEKGIQPSHHRLKILEYLKKHLTHPSVDMIYKNMSKEIPTLSKTTIYNTLDLFLKKGIVSALTIDGNEVRYDINTQSHAHFTCVKCGRLFDIEYDHEFCDKETINGHRIQECHFYLKGICSKCLSKLESRN